MGAGWAAAFDAETTEFRSVSGRSSGPVDATKGTRRQPMTSNTPNNRCIPIPASFHHDPGPAPCSRERLSDLRRPCTLCYVFGLDWTAADQRPHGTDKTELPRP